MQERLAGLLPTLYSAGFTLGFILLTLWLIRRWLNFRRSDSEKSRPPITESQLLKEMKKACRKNNNIKALNIFFRWHDDYGYQTVGVSVRVWLNTLGDNELTASYEQIMKASYSNDKNKNTHLCEVFMRIISSIKRQQRQNQPARWAVKVKLN